MSSTSCCIEVGTSPEQLCYIPCSFCNIVLAVSVPCSSLFDMVTVRCGHCTNLLSVNMSMAAGVNNQCHSNSTSQDDSSSSHHHDHHHHHHHQQDPNHTSRVDLGSSTRCMPTKSPPPSIADDQRTINRPPEKRQRVPSAYNQFIKQEIQRIKANNPNISHREAFSAAAKNLSYVQGSKKRLKSTAE
ncbi:High mobility group (HMG) box domain-containing protein [Cynara cardunculus var. scolymus]|uniref:High mobility group (HMG) box domain-containing protein n=1 Tax=Cynara cardunculus var. scolymus TaxID=59895 RepID=A0A103YM76_CYNCS|nr:High mobility group (HMG) box domain-containing protein [Cynara cardunculus var. scolymus]